MRWDAFMVSCPERETARATSLKSWNETDFVGLTPRVVLDDAPGPTSLARINRNWHRALALAARSPADRILLLEDDIRFNRYLHHNLESWSVGNGAYACGSLYNNSCALSSRGYRDSRTMVILSDFAWGGQGLVLTPSTVQYVLSQWESATGNADIRIPRLASRVTPVVVHVPSLVDHLGRSTWAASLWRDIFPHSAPDFDAMWRHPH